jgi:hypothetical protein
LLALRFTLHKEAKQLAHSPVLSAGQCFQLRLVRWRREKCDELCKSRRLSRHRAPARKKKDPAAAANLKIAGLVATTESVGNYEVAKSSRECWHRAKLSNWFTF